MILRKLVVIAFFPLLLPALLWAQQFGGNPASIKWRQIQTRAGRVIFPPGLDSQANRISNLHQLLSDQRAGSIGGRKRKWDIVLLNKGIIPNAYVRMAPLQSELHMTPEQNSFGTGSLRWDDNLIIHENRHMQQFANFNGGLTSLFSFFLGQEGQLLANGITVPDYFFEGDAVWQETLVSAQGRGRMPSFYNGMKSLWLAGKKYSWMKLRSGSLKDYTPDHYELGYLLVAYGYQKYGPNFWKMVTRDAVHFKGLLYPFNHAIEKYAGRTYPQFRMDALAFFREQSIPLGKQDVPGYRSVTTGADRAVKDYYSPNFITADSILVTRASYSELPAFYILANGHEKKIRVKDLVIDEYFSYRNGKLVYAAYRSDPRRGNRDYSELRLLDIHTGRQRQLTRRSRYFSPDISPDGTQILTVSVNEDGTNYLQRLDASNGAVIKQLPNHHNYFFTHSRYLDASSAISAVRNSEGKMCLVKVDLQSGETERITPFSFNVVGYPFVKGDTVYFSAMNQQSDKVFAATLRGKKVFRLTGNLNGVYQPSVNEKGDVVVSAFTANGSRPVIFDAATLLWQPLSDEQLTETPDLYTASALRRTGAGILYSLTDTPHNSRPYRKALHLFNFHSWRPEVNDPEYSYHLYSDNVLSSFSNIWSYTYNRADRSSSLQVSEAFAGWFPVLSAGAEYRFNRNLDTAVGRGVQFNSAKLNATISLPLAFTGGRTSKFVNAGVGYNVEQLYYRGIGKNVFTNRALDYVNGFLSFSNATRLARQHINPRWAQSVAISYRDAFTLVNSHKLVVNSAFYFPGVAVNHSLVLNASWQKRDTLPDLFSNTFSYSRGYNALSTRRMYKWGANYHLPLFYPDWGFGNIIFFQRVRLNAFYDHTVARARVNGRLGDILNRSAGGELYFDTRVWNALPVSFGVRCSHLLDRDLQHPGLRNFWEFIVPVGLIPD